MMGNTEQLQRIEPRPCELESCANMAYWSYGGMAICYKDMRSMAGMNSDKAEAFAVALDFFSEPDPERAKQILDQIYGDEHPF
jgi:hypothetical protein